MKCKVEKVTPCRRTLSIAVEADQVRPEYDGMVKTFAGSVKVNGFRKGKAPAGLVEKRFEKWILDETKEKLIPRYYREAMIAEKISPVAVLDVREVVMTKEQGLSFKVTVDVPPDFKLPKYRKISLKQQKEEVTDAQVNEAMQRLLESMSRFDEVADRQIQDGDFVKCDFSAVCDGQPLSAAGKDAAPFSEAKDFSLLVGRQDLVPGFSAGILGMTPGSQKSFNLVFPEDFRVAALAGKTAEYSVSIKTVRARVVPELTAEFLKTIGEETEAGLRTRIREDLVRAAEARAKDALRSQVVQFLIEKTDIATPQSLVEQERSAILRDILQRSTMQGVTREQLDEQRDQILESATRSADERVKSMYILGRIAEEEKIEVSDEEVTARIAEMATRYQTTPERVRAEMEKNDRIEDLKGEIKAGKTLDFLIENAKIN